MKKHVSLFVMAAMLMLACMPVAAKKNKNADEQAPKGNYSLACIGFYNLENLFDTINDPNKNDEEFLPDGSYHWTGMKYNAKLKNMAYAISQMGIDKTPIGPMVLGVSEVENIGCLQDLVAQPAIADRNYVPILLEGPDRRGVDVGLLYNPDYFQPTNTKGYTLYIDGEIVYTRYELLVSGYLLGEKVHFIVNHWPSRYGGEEYSRPRRKAAAALCRQICDSIYQRESDARIIIMGDLNDDPFNASTAEVLDAKKNKNDVKPQGYYNTMWKMLDRGIGTLLYNNNWDLFDQIIISEPMAHGDYTKWTFWKPEVFNPEFLIQQDGRYKGAPKRTHSGGVWLNGYSDHFPTMIYLLRKK
ncbi:MAG: endonuclease/exonuclease/phosphatase family protein [Paludibacteraceae bacterium]|nr:endonuclease/exonuclease/phosphatase family protein [Paludibacteraceae bacterium]